jgi:hypothetical protein
MLVVPGWKGNMLGNVGGPRPINLGPLDYSETTLSQCGGNSTLYSIFKFASVDTSLHYGLLIAIPTYLGSSYNSHSPCF